MIEAGPCELWPVVTCCDITSVSPEITGAAHEAATYVMWALSGRQFGSCTVTLLPCPDVCPPGMSFFNDVHWPQPALISGLWYNLGCSGGCHGSCTCNSQEQFTLPRPISSIVEIVIGGEPLPTGAYHVENWVHVVRDDGGRWPECNDGDWQVTVRFGVEVPVIGQLAAGEMLCEFVKACTGQKDCRLPQRVQSLSRQGVSMAFIDPSEFLEKGKTGLYLPDLFISAVNPGRLYAPARIYSPDVSMLRFRT